jgi:hypothetical protein
MKRSELLISSSDSMAAHYTSRFHSHHLNLVDGNDIVRDIIGLSNVIHGHDTGFLATRRHRGKYLSFTACYLLLIVW